MVNSSILGTSDRHIFSSLNGLRGLAAVAVLFFHRRQWFGDGFIFPDAYLAVDFFFILSGFVISSAYSAKLSSSMSFGAFLIRRFNRLMPLAFVAGLLATIVAVVKFAQTGQPAPADFSAEVAGAMTTFPAYWNADAWRLNPPEWSLFMELVVNVMFAFVLTRFRRDLSIAIAGLSLLAFLILYTRIFSGSPEQSSQILLQIPRVIVFFYLGVLLFRFRQSGFLKRVRLNFLTGSALLLLTFVLRDDWAYASEIRLALLLIVYPLVIVGCANLEPKGAMARASGILGDLSYPLYILQIPLLALIAGACAMGGLRQEPGSITEVLVRFAFVGLLSWAILKLIHEPLYGWLQRRTQHRAAAAREAPRGVIQPQSSADGGASMEPVPARLGSRSRSISNGPSRSATSAP